MSGKFMMNGIEYLGGGSGGGGGNVNDVLVNGISVVNEDKEAEIVSYKEVTQSEYEALPDTKLTDGIAYFIKDSTEAEGFPPLIYSLNERQVGVWVDGKPLYELTVHSTGLTPEVNVETNIADLSAYDIDTMVSIQSIDHMTRSIDNINRCMPNATYFEPFYNSTTKYLMFRQNYAGTANNDMYVTIRYTKTTDTAGSGIWAGNGAMAHHYSNDEVIIGTWIDGKPLYEKTFAYNISPVNDWTLFDDSVSYDLLIDVRGYHKNSISEVFPLVASDATNPRWCIQPDHKLYYFITNNVTRSGYITIQYTKTTD